MAGPRTLGTRLRHLLLFLAIVWGVAGTFVVLEIVSLHGMDFVVGHPEWFGDLALPSAIKRSTSCDAAADGRAGSPALSAADVRVGSWLLGMRLGRDAQARQSPTVQPAVLAQSAAGLQSLAGLLAVPAPALFTPANRLMANTEFVEFLERDESGTARGLASAYSPRACQILKLGGLWGYASLSRFALPGEPSIYAMEIAHYARQTALPDALWKPMIVRTPRTATPDDINAESTKLTAAVTQYPGTAH